MATTPQTGRQRADGTTKPSTDRVLSYVVISRNQQCWSSGGAAPAHGRLVAKTVSVQCDKVQLIDATTGKIGYSAYGKQSRQIGWLGNVRRSGLAIRHALVGTRLGVSRPATLIPPVQ